MRRLLTRALQRLGGDRRGGVLALTAFALIPLLLAGGMAVDYARAVRTQTRLQAAADAAAIAAVSKQVVDLPASYNLAADTGPDIANHVASHVFAAVLKPLQANGSALLDMSRPDQFLVTVVDNTEHTSRKVSVTFRGQSPNQFAGILGLAGLTIKGVASSTASAGLYTDIHLLLDTSQSMGLAATEDDARKLWGGVTQYNGHGCQFGCHVAAPGDKVANEWVAKQVGARMRIDVLRDATVEMAREAVAAQGASQLFRMGLYRVGQQASELSPLTADLDRVQSDAAGINLGPNQPEGFGDTDLAGGLSFVLPRIVAHADGSSRDKARAFLFLVTDGVSDLCGTSHCTGPIDPAGCERYRDANVVVAVIYATYLPVKANPMVAGDPALRPEYVNLVQPFAPRIADALKTCASPGWYFEASDGPSLQAAMRRLFHQAIQTPILTR